MQPTLVADFHRQTTAIPAGVRIARFRVVPSFSRATRFENKLRADVIGQVEDFARFGQKELARLDPIRIRLGMAEDLDDLQLRGIGHLDHDPGAQRHVIAGRVQLFRIKRRHHRVLLAQPLDLMVWNQHLKRLGLRCPSGLPPLEHDHLQPPGDV